MNNIAQPKYKFGERVMSPGLLYQDFYIHKIVLVVTQVSGRGNYDYYSLQGVVVNEAFLTPYVEPERKVTITEKELDKILSHHIAIGWGYTSVKDISDHIFKIGNLS